jgi:glycerol-3-phosphate dehydrogenase (NAD(P)+)
VKPMNVTVLGAGQWGTTLASLVSRRHRTVLWARDPAVAAEVNEKKTNEKYLAGFKLAKQLVATSDLAQAAAHADLLFVAVPSVGFRTAVQEAKEYVRPWIPVVSLTKGFESETLLRMTEVIKQEMPGHPAATLTGPNLAPEIMSGMASATVVATDDLAVAGEIQQVVQRGVFRVYVNHDVAGCELGGALKNVIALAVGLGVGLGVGNNTTAAVMTRGLAELTRLGVAMGAEQATFAGLTGMGDLLATCMSPYSRNRRVGEELGKGRKLAEIVGEMDMVAEGVRTAGLVLDLAERYDLDLPICRAVNRVVRGEMAPRDAYWGLMPAGHEADPG